MDVQHFIVLFVNINIKNIYAKNKVFKHLLYFFILIEIIIGFKIYGYFEGYSYNTQNTLTFSMIIISFIAIIFNKKKES